MKQYYITSLYSQNMQVAVQQDHAYTRIIREMIKPENQNSEEFCIFEEYINHHETTICLGVSQPTEILALYAFMKKHADILKIPFGIFQEPSMNYTPTALSFVTNTKLSYPIANEIQAIFKDNKIRSFYNFSDSCTLENFQKTMSVDVDFDERAKPKFTVTFTRNVFKSQQNDDLIPKKLSDDFLDSIYQSHFHEDYCFHNDINPYQKNETETITVTYSIEELAFLILVSRLRLK